MERVSPPIESFTITSLPTIASSAPPATATKLLTNKEAAELIGMSRSFVSKLASSGVLPFVRVGNRLRFRPEAIEQYLKSREMLSVKVRRG